MSRFEGKRFLPSSPPPPSLHFLLGQKSSSVKPNGNSLVLGLISCLHELKLEYCFYIIDNYQVIGDKKFVLFPYSFINCLLSLVDRGQNQPNSQSNNGGAENKLTSTTVPKSDGDAEQTGKDNSGREYDVLESIGLKQIYQLLVSPN